MSRIQYIFFDKKLNKTAKNKDLNFISKKTIKNYKANNNF